MFVFIKPAYPIPATGSVRPKNQKKISPSDRSRKCTTQKTRKSIETNVKRLAVRGKRLSFEIPCSFGLTILPTAHFSTVFVIYILNRGGGGEEGERTTIQPEISVLVIVKRWYIHQWAVLSPSLIAHLRFFLKWSLSFESNCSIVICTNWFEQLDVQNNRCAKWNVLRSSNASKTLINNQTGGIKIE